MNADEQLAAAIQARLNDEGDGYLLQHYVVVVGIQRMDADGSVSSMAWHLTPPDQPDYITDGLIWTEEVARANCDADED